MQRITKWCALLGVMAVCAATPARADGIRQWDLCGGNQPFATCASVNVAVTGTSVAMKIRNLSGLFASVDAPQWVFTVIGLDNLPSAVNATSAVGMSGPTRGSDTPSAWGIFNNTQNGGGINVDLGGDSCSGVKNGIASSCAPSGSLPGGSNELWTTPNADCSGGYSVTNPGLNGGWALFTFNVNQTFDPNAPNTVVFVKGQNGPNGLSPECITSNGSNRDANCFDIPGEDVPPTALPSPSAWRSWAPGWPGSASSGGVARCRSRSSSSAGRCAFGAARSARAALLRFPSTGLNCGVGRAPAGAGSGCARGNARYNCA